MRTHKATLLLMSAACLLPAACATTRYTQSGFAALPPGVEGRAGASATLELDGLKLRVESLDQVARGEEIPPLALRLSFDPSVLGYSFDPGQLSLRGRDGATWRARVADGAGYRALLPGSGYEVAFDVAVTPDAPVDLVVDGLARGSKRLPPVTITLARRSGRSLDRVYWLEVLLAPLGMLAYY